MHLLMVDSLLTTFFLSHVFAVVFLVSFDPWFCRRAEVSFAVSGSEAESVSEQA